VRTRDFTNFRYQVTECTEGDFQLLKINYFKKNDFLKNVIMLTSGTVFAQCLNTVLSPVITRIYSPGEYGIYVLVLAILGSVSAFSAMSYDKAIPIAEDENKAVNLIIISLVMLLIGTLFFTFVLYLLGESILNLLNAKYLKSYIYLLPIGYFFSGLYSILNKWAVRQKNFSSITITMYTQSIFNNITRITLGLLLVGPIGLILGLIIGQSAGIGTLAKPLFREKKAQLRKNNLKELYQTAKRYVRFPFYTTPTFLFLSVSGQLPAIFISFLYGARDAGFYGLALTITLLPMTLIGKSVEDVFYSEAASLGKNNPTEIKALSNKIVKKLFIIGLLPILVLIFFGEFLFSLVFGSNWHVAGTYSSLIALYVFAHFIFQPISSVFYIFERQGKPLLLNILNLLSVLFVFMLAFIFNFNSFTTISVFAAAKVMVELLKYLLVRDILNRQINLQLQ
jgi:O-antigen/teichoic acid export membrane protein